MLQSFESNSCKVVSKRGLVSCVGVGGPKHLCVMVGQEGSSSVMCRGGWVRSQAIYRYV